MSTSPPTSAPAGLLVSSGLSEAEALLLDASALVELVVEGRHAAASARLLDHVERHPELELVSAAHGLIEATSALRRMNLRGDLADAPAAQAVEWLRDLDLRLDPTAARLTALWSRRHTMTAYDAAYAAAAVGLGLPLITADRPLLAACRAADVPAVHLDEAF